MPCLVASGTLCTNLLIWVGREACRDNIIKGILLLYLKIYCICFLSFATYFRISYSMILLAMCTDLYLQPQQTHCILGSDVAFFFGTHMPTLQRKLLAFFFRVYNSFIGLLTTLHGVISQKVVVFIQSVPLATEPGISLIIYH